MAAPTPLASGVGRRRNATLVEIVARTAARGSREGRAIDLFFGLLLFLELRRVAKPQNLTAVVALEDAVRAFGLERHDGYIPRLRSVGGSHAATRQTFECFELEHRRCGPYVAQRT
jgi:hypothetical protein